MASTVSAPKNTGGGGFVFEDDVCAWLFACMLSGEPVLDVDLGPPIRVDFQTRPDGWFLDDALVTTAAGTTQHRLSLSIKSNAQFTASSAPSDFVACAWEQWLHISSQVFNRSQDFMGVVTAPLSGAAAASVSGLAEKARVADPILFPARLATPNWASNDERSLFASFRCPAPLHGTSNATDVDTVRLLQRLRFLQHDFGATTSESLKRVLRLCRTCVSSHAADDAAALWDILRGIASEFRPRAGSITLCGLVERVRRRVFLADYPDHFADWSALDSRSHRDATLVANSIAGRIRISREASVDALASAVATDDMVALLGASGAGKSVVARTMYERRKASGERTLWLDARSLDCADFGAFESALRLQHPFAELLSMATSRNPVLVLDGLDRLYSDNAFRNVATLLRLARQEIPATQWRIVAPCQSNEWPRVLDAVQRAGVTGTRWKQHELERLKSSDLKPVSDSVPALARLLMQPKVATLLTNLKFLDLVAHRVDAGVAPDPANWVGESSVADWFWGAEIDRGLDRLARGRIARALAELLGDQLVTSIPIDDFNVSDMGPLQSLVADQLCISVPGDRIAFAHDLYGDWARLRILLNHRSDLIVFFRDRRESPLWHRALRLLGIHLLEHSGGVDEWRAVLASFGQDELSVVHDVLLEAPVFAVNARSLLDAVLPDLLANDGVLLRRLLTRFLAFATVPNHQMVTLARSFGIDSNTARATYRLPYWPYWIDVLGFLHEHKTAVLSVAPSEVARVVEMWMDFAPKGSVCRSEAAELGVLLGRRALDTRGTYGGEDWQRERERFYRCTLAAAHECPDDVAAIALTAAERSSSTSSPSVAAVNSSQKRRSGPFFGRRPAESVPWPDGPRARIEDAFQNVVLDSGAILELFRVRPAVAREVVLATLIEPPREKDWNDHWLRRMELEVVNRHRWHPTLYTRGPFLACLRISFFDGLELVARLVEFATARSVENAVHEANEWRARALSEGRPEAEVDELIRPHMVKELVIGNGEQSTSFSGDERVYGWSSGVGNPPDAVEAALMALEQYLYQRLDEGKDVVTDVSSVLARSKSVAFLGVLCDVGKRHRMLFEGPLRSLLSVPELYSWEITKMVEGRTHLMIGASAEGEWFVDLARKFHNLEHRKVDLRHVAILMLQRPAMREYFDGVREAWRAMPASSSRLSLLRQQMSIALDPLNYEIREDPEHGVVLINVEALRVQEERAGERQAMDDHMLVTAFPMRCRKILDKHEASPDEELAELWQQWIRIRQLASLGNKLPNGDERFGDEYPNAIIGGVAVFLMHAAWNSKDASRLGEILTALRSTMKDVQEKQTFDIDNSLSTWTWECFAAEAFAMLWAQDTDNAEWRRAVAEAVLCQRYAATKLLFDRCAKSRASLGEDFARLRRIALEWAHVRKRVDLLRHVPLETLQLDGEALEQVKQEVVTWAEERLTAFVAGSSDGMPSDWARLNDEIRVRDLEATHRSLPGAPRMDFHVVRCAHEWLPYPNDARDEREREESIRFWRAALGIVIERPRASPDRGDRQYPHGDESWVLERVAAAVLQLRDDEQPDVLWQPIIDLYGEAHDWPEMFAHALHRHALTAERTPSTYTHLVRMMVRRAFTNINGKRRWSPYEHVWDSLLGIDGYSRDLWELRHAKVVSDLSDAFELWMDRVPPNGRRLAGFASWLTRASGAPLRLGALRWFLGLLRVDERREIDGAEEAEDAIAALLNLVWTEEQPRLRGNQQVFEAFRGLLGWLGNRQNQLGLELLGRIGSLA